MLESNRRRYLPTTTSCCFANVFFFFLHPARSFFATAQIVNDNMLYAKVVVRMGVRTECKNCDFSDILEDEDVSCERPLSLQVLNYPRFFAISKSIRFPCVIHNLDLLIVLLCFVFMEWGPAVCVIGCLNEPSENFVPQGERSRLQHDSRKFESFPFDSIEGIVLTPFCSQEFEDEKLFPSLFSCGSSSSTRRRATQ